MSDISNSMPTSLPPHGLTVAADEVSIYEGGNLITIAIGDVLNNEVAVRQLINDYNWTKRTNVLLEQETVTLRIERAAHEVQPLVLIGNAVTAIIGAGLVGLGTNLLTQATPPPGSGWILAAGVALSILTSVLPIALPWVTKANLRRRGDAAAK